MFKIQNEKLLLREYNNIRPKGGLKESICE